MFTTSTTITFILLPLITAFLTYVTLRLYMRYAKQHNLTATDVHKPNQPQVVDQAGNILPSLLLLLFLPSFLLTNVFSNIRVPLAIFLSGILGYIVGFIDDHKSLGLVKIPLMLIAGIPLIFLHTYNPRPFFPFIGRARLTILYPYVVCIITAVISNGVNMIDVVNGSAVTQSMFGAFTIAFWSFICISKDSYQNHTYSLYALIVLAILAGFFALNKYPAKIFLGNSGAYTFGATLAALTIVTQKEYVAMISFLPMILNAFLKLASLGGVKTKENFKAPVIIKNGTLLPNEEKGSPLSMVGFRASVEPVKEPQVIKFFNILYLLSFLFSLITGIFIFYTNLFPFLPL